MTLHLRARAGEDRGGLSLETAILVPVLILVLAMAVAAGRITAADNAVDTAARNAARAASLERDGAAGHTAGTTVATASLRDQGLQCTSSSVEVTTEGFSAPLGEPATTTATVACTVRLSDIGLPGLPGAKTLQARSTSSLDSYRAR